MSEEDKALTQCAREIRSHEKKIVALEQALATEEQELAEARQIIETYETKCYEGLTTLLKGFDDLKRERDRLRAEIEQLKQQLVFIHECTAEEDWKFWAKKQLEEQ